MKLAVVSSAPIVVLNNKNYMYGPYQKEMRLWAKYAKNIQFCCPIWSDDRGLLIDEISFPISNTIELKEFNIKSISKLPSTLYYTILNFFIILKAFNRADHIHLRCPGNMGLIAAFAQIFFPNKPKTAKYAGNWDPKSKQPWSYRLQKRILSSTFLSKNMQVLVYGKWENQTKNIKSFFTATYRNSEIEKINDRDYNGLLKFVFIGSLVIGKRPLLTLKIIEALHNNGYNVSLDFFGNGNLKPEIFQYILDHNLAKVVTIHGNQTKEVVKAALKTAHFSILPSKSEGWPKAIAEAMFFGCIPIVTKISCVPYMLDFGKRGILIKPNIEEATKEIIKALENKNELNAKSIAALQWSQQYTLDLFESEISKLLKII